MITIRPSQLDALREARDKELIREVAGRLREHLTAAVQPLDDETLETHLRALRARVRGHGIESEQDFARIANVAAALGFRLESHPWLDGYLSDASVGDPAERVRRVVSRGVREVERQEKNWRARAAFKGGSGG